MLNTDLDDIDAQVYATASVVAIAGTEIINISTSQAGVSSSLAGVSTSLGHVSSSQTGISTSLGNVSSSISGNTASLSALSASVSTNAATGANVSSSLGNVSSSLANVATSQTAISTSLSALPQAGTNANSAGTLGLAQVTKSANYTLALADAGTELFFTSTATVTIPANASVAFQRGTVIKLSAASGVTLTVAITSDTLVLESSGATGSRTVTGRGHLAISKALSTEWWGVGVNVA